ncbi:cell cycle control protein 50A [Aphelenchoides avenae]|nr:cell cycle control protein 50A [Aphelenchus avenae]
MIEVPLTTEDALPADLRRKYRNPIPCSPTDEKCEGFNDTAKPPNWQQHVSKLGYDTQNGRALENFDFIVWMETAALPNFPYPVKAYGGRKKFIIATHGMMGRKSNFQSIAFFALSVFILVACLSICAVEFMGTTICSLLRRFQ